LVGTLEFVVLVQAIKLGLEFDSQQTSKFGEASGIFGSNVLDRAQVFD
jgi:hypothetical protein